MESRKTPVLVVTAIMLALSTGFTALRMISRLAIVHRVSWDDYFIVLALIICFLMSFAVCYATKFGLGLHEQNILLEWSTPLRKAEYAFDILYNPALMATKTSILYFYLSLSKGNKIFRYSTLATLAIVIVAGAVLTFLNIFQCTPIKAVYQSPISETAECIDILTLYLSSAPVNIITDLAILFLPMPVLTALRLPTKQKTILVITFGFGFFVAVVDVIRIVYLQRAIIQRSQSVHVDDQFDDAEASWYFSLSYMWSAIEVNLGIMVANVPGLKPLVSRFMPLLLGDRTSIFRSSRYMDEKSTIQAGMRSSQISPISQDLSGPTLSPNSISSSTSPSPSPSPSSPPSQPPQPPQPPQSSPSSPPPPPPPPPVVNNLNEQELGIMDFLTTPDMNELPLHLQPTTLPIESTGIPLPQEPVTFFDFVTFETKKSLVNLTVRESIFPVAMVTILFFLWGIAYGFLFSLSNRFQAVANMTYWQTMANHAAYFGAYIFGSMIPGRLILNNLGFKACFIAGLVVYACGVLCFWPAAVLLSFPAFFISNFIVGVGLSILEVAANPFVTLCGPPKWMELRLNLSQAIQAIGSVCSPLLADKVLFKNKDGMELLDVQWTYLGIALFVVLLAVAYYYVPLPEASDESLEAATASQPKSAHLVTFCGCKLIYINVGLAVFSQFLYVGSQESLSISFNYLTTLAFSQTFSPYSSLAIAHTLFAAGRFAAVLLNLIIKPRILLATFIAAALLSSILVHTLAHPRSAYFAAQALFFCEGPVFGFIFALGLRGQAARAKDAAVLLTAAIGVGGAVFPLLLAPIARGDMTRVQYALVLVVATWAASALFPLFLNGVPAVRELVDWHGAGAGAGGAGGAGRATAAGTAASERAGEVRRPGNVPAAMPELREWRDSLSVSSVLGAEHDVRVGASDDRRPSGAMQVESVIASNRAPSIRHRRSSSDLA